MSVAADIALPVCVMNVLDICGYPSYNAGVSLVFGLGAGWHQALFLCRYLLFIEPVIDLVSVSCVRYGPAPDDIVKRRSFHIDFFRKCVIGKVPVQPDRFDYFVFILRHHLLLSVYDSIRIKVAKSNKINVNVINIFYSLPGGIS